MLLEFSQYLENYLWPNISPKVRVERVREVMSAAYLKLNSQNIYIKNFSTTLVIEIAFYSCKKQ